MRARRTEVTAQEPNLTWLDIEATDITDEAISTLSTRSSLRVQDVCQTALTTSACPRC